MQPQEQVERAQAFLQEVYLQDLHKQQHKGEYALVMDFQKLAVHDPELADALLEEPEDIIRAFELAMENLLDNKRFRARFTNLPAAQSIAIRNIRSIHINRLMFLQGIVRQSSDVRPQVTSAKFECPSCGNTISILQLEQRFKEPSRCTCGRRGKFRLISKDLVDAQRLVLEESPELLEGGEQPKRLSIFLQEDLVEPKMEKKSTPGCKIMVTGIVKEVPILLRTGAASTRYDLMMEANSIIPIEETFEELDINEEDEEKIKDLSKDARIFERLCNSIAPSIYGHDKVKEALVLQLMGGVQKQREDGTKTRGDMHVLLVGDPGCIAGDSQVALISKGMKPIKEMGKYHGQKIRERVVKLRKNQKDKHYDFTENFQQYFQQPVLKVLTETGKQVVCTFNQPFLTKQGWRRADEIPLGTKIRVMPKIPTMVNNDARTGFTTLKRSSGPLKEATIPERFTPELAALSGYLLGDGNLHPAGYRVTAYVNEEEKDLIGKLSQLWQETFQVKPEVFTRTGQKIKTIHEGRGLLRQIISTQQMHIIEVNSKQVASCFSFLSVKKVPQQIFQSPLPVIASFLSWLFEADGCAFESKERGRTAIQLKSATPRLLQDVQLLLLYFGIHSRINKSNLCIRRAGDIKAFLTHIGFQSQKKMKRSKEVFRRAEELSKTYPWKKSQRWEKLVEILPAGIMDVYDFEVPRSRQFIANGIVCHNSGKSQLLIFISKIAPKARYISGKGATSAGLTASVVKDEFLKGWALEAGAMVLANGGFCVIDELDKMSHEDTSALHEALEQQRISISKANIQATLRTQTTVLAAANPKLGRFDPYAPIASQIDMPPALINRFDLIFPIRDIPNREMDARIASHVLKLQQKPSELYSEIPAGLLRKYIAYARSRIKPVLSDTAIEEIQKFYVELRNKGQRGDEGVKPIPISARQLEALVRLAEGSARVRLSKKVAASDAKRSIELLKHCLMQVGFDYETGEIDIDRITTGISSSQRSRIITIREIIRDLEGKHGRNIPLEDIIAAAHDKKIDEAQVEESIERLKREGEIFEPRPGQIARL